MACSRNSSRDMFEGSGEVAQGLADRSFADEVVKAGDYFRFVREFKNIDDNTIEQNELDKVFRTTNDEYISFEGEDIPIECSYSMSMQNTITSIYYDSGESIALSSNRLVFVTLSSVFNSPTVYCNVSGDMQGSAKFTITTIPRDESPYCVSSNDGGVIANAAVKLSCYIDTVDPVNLIEQWRDSNNMVLPMDERKNIFGNTRKILRTVMVNSTNNGTNYTCVEIRSGSISGSCQVGPIFAYNNVFTYIEFQETRNLSHGDTGEFRCSSIPSSNITWTMLQPGDEAGIVVVIDGSVITITVPHNVSFVGRFEALCEGKVNDEQGSTLLNIYISAMSRPTMVSDEAVESVTAPPESTSTMTMTTEDNLVGVIILAAGGGSIVTAIGLFSFFYCHYKINMKMNNTNQPVDSSSLHLDHIYSHDITRNTSAIIMDGNKASENRGYNHIGPNDEASNQFKEDFGQTYDSTYSSTIYHH